MTRKPINYEYWLVPNPGVGIPANSWVVVNNHQAPRRKIIATFTEEEKEIIALLDMVCSVEMWTVVKARGYVHTVAQQSAFRDYFLWEAKDEYRNTQHTKIHS